MQYRESLVLGLLASAAIARSTTWSDLNFNLRYEEAISSSTESLLKDNALAHVLLPYENHTASPDSKENQTFYRFANIPYAKQPVGHRRFKAAEPLSTVRVDPLPVNNGQKEVVCPQGIYGWPYVAGEFSDALFAEEPLDPKWSQKITPANYTPIEDTLPVPNQSESCLVLDVFVPKRLFDNHNTVGKVVVSFMSQDFVYGSRNYLGLPQGLLQQSSQFGEDSDIVYISVNYRLGALGWLAGDQFVEDGGLENAGLTDQTRALEWVKEYAKLFNGDPDDVTVIGSSAGAASVMHLVAAYPGLDDHNRPPLNFNRAIVQSPAFFPNTNRKTMDQGYKSFLDAAGAKTFKDLQEASSEVMIEANRKAIYYAPFGLQNYGPVVSKDTKSMIPAPPALIFKHGRSQVDKLEYLMLSSVRQEGGRFTPPWTRTNAALKEHIHQIFPEMTPSNVDVVMSKYKISDTSTDERLKFIQATKLFGDLMVDCDVWALREATKKPQQTYEYLYDMFPGDHFQDAGATFWNVTDFRLLQNNNEIQSQRLQRYLTSFIKTGSPNTQKLDSDLEFHDVGHDNSKGKYMYLGTGVPGSPPPFTRNDDTWHGMRDTDPLPSRDRCEVWADALYWNQDGYGYGHRDTSGGDETWINERVLQQEL